MAEDQWLTGWREIGLYIGKSAKTAQRYARDGMPFFRDPGGRPIAKPSMIDEYLSDLNQSKYEDKSWRDKGIDTALEYEDGKKKRLEDFDKQLIEAQRPSKSRF
jgi:hypothetical protein